MTNIFVENITTEVEIQAGYDLFEIVVEDFDQEKIEEYAEEAAQSAAEALASENAAANSADAASGSATTATTQAGIATTQAGIATTQSGIATTQAGIATTQSGIATTQAGIATTQSGIATTKANEASASAAGALASEQAADADRIAAQAAASTATTQAGIATTQAGIATTKAGEASDSAAAALASETDAETAASTATTQAGIATTQAGIATTQAGIATTQASNALTSANEAAASAASAAQVGTSTPLTGFSTGANSTILATDTILQGFNKTQGQINARVSGTIATNQVAFGTAANTIGGDSGLFWNNTNKRLGVGTNVPSNSLHVNAPVGEDGFDAIPVLFIRNTTVTSSFVSSMIGLAKSTGNMTDGFGPRFLFSISDDTFGDRTNQIAAIGGIRTGADNSGSIIFQTATTGTNTTKIQVFPTGNTTIQNGGTFTDAGFRLDVNGTARVQGNLNVSTGGITLTGAQTIQTSTGNLTLTSADNTGIVDIRRTDRVLGAELRLTNSFNGSGYLAGDIIGTLNFFTSDATGIGPHSVANITAVSGGENAASPDGNLVFSTGGYNVAASERWRITSTGVLQSNGAQTIQTSTGALTLQPSNNVLIGTTTDVASSKLTIQSTTQGFLPPRMTSTQRDAIASPAAGLIIYNTTTNLLNVYNGTMWI